MHGSGSSYDYVSSVTGLNDKQIPSPLVLDCGIQKPFTEVEKNLKTWVVKCYIVMIVIVIVQ